MLFRLHGEIPSPTSSPAQCDPVTHFPYRCKSSLFITFSRHAFRAPFGWARAIRKYVQRRQQNWKNNLGHISEAQKRMYWTFNFGDACASFHKLVSGKPAATNSTSGESSSQPTN
jgi:hypothetical protein